MSKSDDPTDYALATIASILDQPASAPELQKTTPVEKPVIGAFEADGYHKVGPGPIAGIRFKWTVRRDSSGDYYVEETIGENSTPVAEGPMSADAAVKLVDSLESQARQRFEQLKHEMLVKGAASKSA